MKHILLQFAEVPDGENIDTSFIEYSPVLNLSIVKGTDIPAVTFSDQATETFTKTNGEGTDSDHNLKYQALDSLMDTTTATRTHGETTDSDPRHHDLSSLLDTATHTFVKSEASDSDQHFKDLAFLSATRTLTETVETVDSDK